MFKTNWKNKAMIYMLYRVLLNMDFYERKPVVLSGTIRKPGK